jgi:predicted enzyme related to lactoylglutathione lyase
MAKHSIVHVEFSAKDPKAAGEFYKELFGWKITEDTNMDYVMFDAEEGPGGGLPRVSDSTPAGAVLVHVSTDDIEASLAKVKKLGGSTVVPKTEIPGFGWFAIFSDPTGNNVGLYTAKNPQ